MPLMRACLRTWHRSRSTGSGSGFSGAAEFRERCGRCWLWWVSYSHRIRRWRPTVPQGGSGDDGAEIRSHTVIEGLLAADAAFACQQTAIVPAVHDAERSPGASPDSAAGHRSARTFGIPLVIRCVRRACGTAEEAIRAPRRIPVHMSRNVTMLNRDSRRATVYQGPGTGGYRPGSSSSASAPDWRKAARI
jgi:hypothetical protein